MKYIDDSLSISTKSSTKTRRNRKPAEWQKNENIELLKQIKKFKKEVDWNLVAKRMQRKFDEDEHQFNAKACKDRYNHYLKEGLNLEEFTEEEIHRLIQLIKEHENQWSIISKFMNNRTEQFVKNKFYAMVRKTLRTLYQIATQQRNSSNITNRIKPYILTKFLCGNEDDESLTSYEKQIRMIAQNLVFNNLKITKQSELSLQDKDKLFIVLDFMNKKSELYRKEEKRVPNKPQKNKKVHPGVFSIPEFPQQIIINTQGGEFSSNPRIQNIPSSNWQSVTPSSSGQSDSTLSRFNNFQTYSYTNYIVSLIVPYYSNGFPSHSAPQN